jgi:hypothetical protein
MKTVHLFVFDTLSDWEPGFAIAGINNPQFQQQPGRYQVRTASLGGKAVTTIGGVKIQPDAALETIDAKNSAMLILPGGALWDQGGNAEAVQKAKDAVKHTSNAREYVAASGYRGGNLYQDRPVVSDKNIITASAMAPLEFAREIFAALDLYSTEVLDAWYKLFSTRKPEYFGALMAASAA